jgi:hypothetical protein
MMIRKLPLFISFLFTACMPALALPGEIPVMLDPGHGGAILQRKDDKWDPITKQYLDFYLTGMMYGQLTEHEVVLDLSFRVKKYLELTRSDEGWLEFEKILRLFSSEQKFERVRFRVDMARTDDWRKSGKPKDHPDINAPYRMYDFPKSPGSTEMEMGRFSWINSKKPYLVVALHLNPAEGANPGGMGAVLSPGYPTFEVLRKITLGQAPASEFYKLPWAKSWLISDYGFNQLQSAQGDAWVYFHGYRMLKDGSGPWKAKNRGLRYNMIQWRYRDPPGWEKIAARGGPGQYALKYSEFKAVGPFFDRERSAPELWRREGGPLGFGGDNHYASDELLRFIRMGVPAQVPSRRAPGTMPEIVPPFISTYGLPTFTNAICAYLEVAHLNRTRDRSMVLDHQEEVAKSLAAGIYSLFRGIKVKPFQGTAPRGAPLNFERYVKAPGGNYFEQVTD